ncbi:methyltransferase domain-containing protein [Micromonospora sp. WMMD1128]|uniref:methyltransferase domain-containing protein n=1 Tax=unclassified Micromonospora TaxID=2617518 RepID=UPI00248B87D7|nr:MULTISPECIES: methyltransferase domain-containing protein [unclassified Micromonospora]WBB73860.1 methyltransferase domain-containing protein [Micromonospora sp. WMMD1128]WFE32734.1 methyltransferase domain-containing protein [Micromonospora sp. WMMD975]
MDSRDRDLVLRLRNRHQDIVEPRTFELLGQEWDLLPGVYAPHLTPSAALYAEWLAYPTGGSFCEMGCGTGYLSVIAAQRGCAAVTALDISAAAVENTRRNAERHGVADRVTARCGDMFQPLTGDERFDLIFWNSNFVGASPGESPDDLLDRAFFDPGYVAHAAFLGTVGRHLAPGGRVMLGFTDLGDSAMLGRIAAEHGWRPVTRRCAVGEYPDGELRYELIELLRS